MHVTVCWCSKQQFLALKGMKGNVEACLHTKTIHKGEKANFNCKPLHTLIYYCKNHQGIQDERASALEVREILEIWRAYFFGSRNAAVCPVQVEFSLTLKRRGPSTSFSLIIFCKGDHPKLKFLFPHDSTH